MLRGKRGGGWYTRWRHLSGGGESVEDAELGPLAGAEAFALVQAGAHAEALEAAKRAREAGADEGVCLLVQALAEAGLGRQVAAITTLERAQAAPGTTGIEATLRAILEREARVRVGA